MAGRPIEGEAELEDVEYGERFQQVTGWLLVAWVVHHVVVPTLEIAPTAVQQATSTPLVVALVIVSLLHGFNGIRLLLVEVGGLEMLNTRVAYLATLVIASAVIVPVARMVVF